MPRQRARPGADLQPSAGPSGRLTHHWEACELGYASIKASNAVMTLRSPPLPLVASQPPPHSTTLPS